MIIIRHRTGPLGGTVRSLDASPGRISFGRSYECDVVYPPDLTAVSRRHFAIERRPSGQWTFDIFGDLFVAMNGTPVESGVVVRSGAVIELGRRGGPSFEIEIEADTRTSTMPLTELQEQVLSPRSVAERAWSALAWTRRIAIIGGIVAVAAVLALAALTYWNRSQTERLNQAIAAIASAQNRADAERISIDVRNRISRAAFLVAVRDANGREQGHATAWPVSANLVVTNAHVAAMADALAPGETMVVRTPGPEGQSYEVVGRTIHPGYEAFAALVGRTPILVPSFGGGREEVKLANGYDVALLRLNRELTNDAILQLASPAELAALKPGDPVAYAGYPQEQVIGSEVQRYGPSPEVQVGNITSMTDFFMLPGDPSQRRLIHHNLPAAGGSSGSPIVAASGRVVGILSAGNLFVVPVKGESLRLPNAAMINYAQSAMLAAELLAGSAEQSLAHDKLYWAAQLAKVKQGVDQIAQIVLDSVRPPSAAGTPELSIDAAEALGASDRIKDQRPGRPENVMRGRGHPIRLRAGEVHTFLAYTTDPAGITLYVFDENHTLLTKSNETVYPAVTYQAVADATANVVVLGPDKDIAYRFRDYIWRR